MTQEHFCNNCGATLQPGAHFCENCGQAVGVSTPAPVRSQPKRRFPWWILILSIGCLGMICLAVVGVVGYAYFQNRTIGEPAAPVPIIIEVSATTQILPTATLAAPSPAPAPTDSGLTLTGEQRLDDHSFYDDFSSDALGWPVFDDGKTIIRYENEAYRLQRQSITLTGPISRWISSLMRSGSTCRDCPASRMAPLASSVNSRIQTITITPSSICKIILTSSRKL